MRSITQRLVIVAHTYMHAHTYINTNMLTGFTCLLLSESAEASHWVLCEICLHPLVREIFLVQQ